MNPYRIEAEKEMPPDAPHNHEDDLAIVWVWFSIGMTMLIADVTQSARWGTGASLGAVLALLGSFALRRHYSTKWQRHAVARYAHKAGEV